MGLFLLALVAASTGWAAIYHVSPSGNDGNPGTLVAPWATFTKANTVLVAGDTAIIHAGTYSGQRIEPVHSGSPGHYITYKGATDEAMPVVTASPSLSIPGERPPVRRVAIVLNGNHHIWIEGLKISGGAARPPEGAGPNLDGWAVLYGASYNVIKDNYFEYAYGWTGFRLNGGSAFNRIIGNTMRVAGTYDNGLRPVSAKDVMGAELLQICTGTNFNQVEANDLRLGGHNVLSIQGSRNLIRGNYLDNDWGALPGTSNDGIGYRVGELTATGKPGEDLTAVGYNLFEDNIVTGTRQVRFSDPQAQGGMSRTVNPTNLKIEGTGQIVRGNFFIHNIADVLSTVIRGNGVPLSLNNHIYNNTIYGNGGGAWVVHNFENATERLDGNVFMNNLAYKNRQNAAFASGEHDRDIAMDAGLSSGSGHKITAHNRIFNNSIVRAHSGDAMVHVVGPGHHSLEWYEAPVNGYAENFFGNLQQEPRFVAVTGPRDTREKFDLDPTSPLIDAGAFLTQTTAGAGHDVTVVFVVDAGYFYPGIPELSISGDLVRIGANSPVRVTAVNYVTHALTLATPVSWSGGIANVSLDYYGMKPDIGAREFRANTRRP